MKKLITLITTVLLLTCLSATTFGQAYPVPPSPTPSQYVFANMNSWYNLSIPLHNHIDTIKTTGHFYLFQKEPRQGDISFSVGLATVGTYTNIPTVKAWLEVTNDTGLIWSIAPQYVGSSTSVTTSTVTTLNATIATTYTGTIYTDTFNFSDSSRAWLGHNYGLVPSVFARYRLNINVTTLPSGMYILPAGMYAWKQDD